MKHRYLPFLFVLLTLPTFAQQINIDFESANLPLDTFRNGFDTDNQPFVFEGVEFPSVWNPDFGGFWQSGWAVSTRTDTVNGTFTNLYSAAPGSGNDSPTYLVGQQLAGFRIPGEAEAGRCVSAVVTNTTYGATVIRDGNDFSKPFGGDDGTDPDFFDLTMRLYLGAMIQDSVTFPLADFRSDNPNEDFIVRDWTHIDYLDGETVFDSISFRMNSSDTSGGFINTPLFFALDELHIGSGACVVDTYAPELLVGARIFPNPAREWLRVELTTTITAPELTLFDVLGRPVRHVRLPPSTVAHEFDLNDLTPGVYTLTVRDGQRVASQRVVIQ